ncbi:MAG: divergent polysaccharide deacetylase family protein [Pseudomonadota bacterium]|nr:divergent polysaccharide deacetylase family protein [Pseudomonadota bacterium]
MTAILRRRFRPPVLGRLAWAWLAFALAGGGFGLYALFAGDMTDTPARIALPLRGDIDRLAPVATASVLDRASGAKPALRGDNDEFSPETDDVFAGGDMARLDQPQAYDEPDGAIVITIDNGKRPEPAAAATVSLTKPPVRIPDADPALLLKTSLGMRPKIAADGRRASRLYARPFANDEAKPIVALIVGGLGLNADLTERAITELPPEVTLAFAPYAKDLDYWTKRARDAGHELMVELPMEAHGGDPSSLGPAALLSNRASEDNLQRLDWLMSRFGAYFGATNYLGGKFSTEREALDPVLARLAASGVAYVDDTGAARRVGSGAGPLAIVNRMVTPGYDGGDAAAATRDLKALSAIAKRSGDALGKAYAYDATIDAVLAWAEELEASGVVLAPASAIVNDRGRDL